MFDNPPIFFLFAATVVAAYILTAMFLGLVRDEHPDKFKELTGPNELFSSVSGPFYLGLNYILPLDYESWGLSTKTIWIGRVLFLVNVFSLLLVLWLLISLLRL